MKIYKICCSVPGIDKVYIGQTTGDLSTRLQGHFYKSENGFKYAISEAIRKYGQTHFTIEEIDSAKTLEELNEKEVYWIAFYNSIAPHGYNLCSGGKNFKMSDETKKKMSEAGKGKIPWNVGIEHSDETKKKISEKALGNTRWLGKVHTEETKRKLSETHAGVPKPCNSHPRPEMFSGIICLTNGEKYESILEASRKLNIHASGISAVCRGKRGHVGGFKFMYEGDEEPKFVAKVQEYKTGEDHWRTGTKMSDEIRQKMSDSKKGKRPNYIITSENHPRARAIICTNTGIEYKSATEAGRQLNINRKLINKVLTGRSKSTNGLQFKYLEEFNDNSRRDINESGSGISA